MSAIIAKFRVFIKSIQKLIGNEDIMLTLVIISVSVGSFLIGRSSISVETSPRFTMNDIPDATKEQIRAAVTPGDDVFVEMSETQGKTTIFGSKSGTKYYFSWCSGASRVKLENRVYYQSEQEAKSAGRSVASGCH
jgi:hypothetical protein